MKLRVKSSAVLATVVLVLTTVGVTPAAAAHYQGGDYSRCAYPPNPDYDGVFVEGYGLGSDVPSRNYYSAARGIVVAAAKCVRTGAVYFVTSVQVDKVAVRINNVNYGTVGPVNKHSLRLTVDSRGVRLPACGQYAQAAMRFSARYSDGSLLRGVLNSGSFRRC